MAGLPSWTWSAAYLVALVAALVAAVFLLYRVLELAHIRDVASWLWQIGLVAFTLAAASVAAGLLVSLRPPAGDPAALGATRLR